MCPVKPPPWSHLLAAFTPTPQSPNKCNSIVVIIIIMVAIIEEVLKSKLYSASWGKECVLKEIFKVTGKAEQRMYDLRLHNIWYFGWIWYLNFFFVFNGALPEDSLFILSDLLYPSSSYEGVLRCPPSSSIWGSGLFCFVTMASNGAKNENKTKPEWLSQLSLHLKSHHKHRTHLRDFIQHINCEILNSSGKYIWEL